MYVYILMQIYIRKQQRKLKPIHVHVFHHLHVNAGQCCTCILLVFSHRCTCKLYL